MDLQIISGSILLMNEEDATRLDQQGKDRGQKHKRGNLLQAVSSNLMTGFIRSFAIAR